MPTQQFGTQRLNDDQQEYWANNNIQFTDILNYRPLTQVQINMLTRVYYTENNLVGARKLYTAVFPRLPNPPSQRQVQAWLANQLIAQRNKPAPRSKSHNPIMVKRPLERLQIDCLNMGVRQTNRGRRFLLNAVDIFTKKAWSRVMRTPNIGLQKTAPTAQKALTAFTSILHEIRRDYGKYPERFQSDNGSEFLGVFKQAFMPGGEFENIKTNYSIAYRATSQSVVERFNQTLRKMIAKYIQADTLQREENPAGPRMQPWPDVVPLMLANYNTNIHSTLKRTPNSMFDATRAELQEIKDRINAKHLQQNRNLNLIAVGTTVRLKDFKEAKNDMTKDEPHWGTTIYTVIKHIFNRRTNVTEYQIEDDGGNDPPTHLRAGGSGAGRTGDLNRRRRFTRYELLPVGAIEAPQFLLDNNQEEEEMPLHVLQAQGIDKPPSLQVAQRFLRNHSNPDKILGKDVNIKWDAEGPLDLAGLGERGTQGTYYKARVLAYNPITGLHTVRYTHDGVVFKHNLFKPNKPDYQPYNLLN